MCCGASRFCRFSFFLGGGPVDPSLAPLAPEATDGVGVCGGALCCTDIGSATLNIAEEWSDRILLYYLF